MSEGGMSENVPLASLTTLGVGGAARFFIEVHTDKEVEGAIAFARRHSLPLLPLGKGSNVLVPDAGVEGVVVKMSFQDMQTEEDGENVILIAGAGTLWEDVVEEASARGAFGIENLAGIPGSAGGAAVQNIGAYGAELASVCAYVDCIDRATGEKRRVTRAEAAFAYRTSFFKEHAAPVITRVALRLAKRAALNTAYADLERARRAGTPLSTPSEIARAVRAIRAEKFPQNPREGTAGSFFKNPVVPQEMAALLAARYPGLPVFPQGEDKAKLSLAWLLDRVLSLKGFSLGPVRLYERQPLVIVAHAGARAADVEELAALVEERVFTVTGIRIEREVETFGK